MVVNVISVLILVALVVFFAWLTQRAGAMRNAVLRWIGFILAGLVTLILALVAIVAVVGFIKLYTPASNPVSDVQVAKNADQIVRGQKLSNICASCHSTTGRPPLDGGANNYMGPLGSLYPENLTPAGPLKDWSDGQIIRAVREGVDNTGNPLLVMPSDQFHGMSDADVQALVAYLHSQPPVPHDTPPVSPNLFGAVIIGLGFFPTSQQPPITQPVIAPPDGTAEHGQYLADISGCRACHGADLTGGNPAGYTPVGPNLTVLIPKWNQFDFIKEMRTGVDPTGHVTSSEMPWKAFSAAYSDAELGDMYKYLHGLKPTLKSAK